MSEARRDMFKIMTTDAWYRKAADMEQGEDVGAGTDARREPLSCTCKGNGEHCYLCLYGEGAARELLALAARVQEAERERDKWRRIRTPTHGNCCTCQRCGVNHDSCRCDLDEVCDELDQVKKQLADMTRERDAFKQQCKCLYCGAHHLNISVCSKCTFSKPEAKAFTVDQITQQLADAQATVARLREAGEDLLRSPLLDFEARRKFQAALRETGAGEEAMPEART